MDPADRKRREPPPHEAEAQPLKKHASTPAIIEEADPKVTLISFASRNGMLECGNIDAITMNFH